MNKKDAPKVSQIALSKGYRLNSQTFWHRAQWSLLGKVLPEGFYYDYIVPS